MSSNILSYTQQRKVNEQELPKASGSTLLFILLTPLFNKCSSLNTEINKKLMIEISILFNIHCFTCYKMETGNTLLNGLKI